MLRRRRKHQPQPPPDTVNVTLRRRIAAYSLLDEPGGNATYLSAHDDELVSGRSIETSMEQLLAWSEQNTALDSLEEAEEELTLSTSIV